MNPTLQYGASRRPFHSQTLSVLRAPNWKLAASVALCGALSLSTFAAKAATSIDLNQHGISGAWYNPASSGQGFVISVMPNADGAGHAGYFGGWFTFTPADPWVESYGQPAGSPTWFTLQGSAADVQPDYGVALGIFDNDGRLGRFDAAPKVPAVALGRAYISMSDCNHLHLHYTVQQRANWLDPIWADMDLVRLLPNISCSEIQPAPAPVPSTFGYSGAWYDPATSGQGFAFEVNPAIGANAGSSTGWIFGGWFTYARSNVAATDTGRRWYSLQGGYAAGSAKLIGDVGIYETTGGTFATNNSALTPVLTTQVGVAKVVFISCTVASVTYQFYGGENAGLANTINLQRVGGVPADCVD